MISTKLITAAALALAVTLPAMPAQAGAPRTFVSAAGTDNSTCSFAAPCRHFQNAVDATSAGGEVDALDPAGYGPITINHAVTIEGQGWSYIAPPVNGNGITINVGSGNVVIHGVSVNGAGISGGTNGIVFNSGSGLTVTDCVLQNFFNSGAETTGDGILMQPSAGTAIIFISRTDRCQQRLCGPLLLAARRFDCYCKRDHRPRGGNKQRCKRWWGRNYSQHRQWWGSDDLLYY